MTEHDAARLFAGEAFELAHDVMADAAEARRVLAVARVLIDFQTTRLARAFGDDDDAELRIATLALVNFLRHRLHRKRNFGNEDHVRAARDAGMQSDPTRVPSHHFEEHHAVVRGGGRVQAV
jgi:hypothetical protein